MSVIMVARLKARYGYGGALNEVLTDVVALLEAHGWKLLDAYETVIGDLCEVLNVWELPDADAVHQVLRVELADDPAAHQAMARLRELIVEESLSIVTRSPYDPSRRAG